MFPLSQRRVIEICDPETLAGKCGRLMLVLGYALRSRAASWRTYASRMWRRDRPGCGQRVRARQNRTASGHRPGHPVARLDPCARRTRCGLRFPVARRHATRRAVPTQLHDWEAINEPTAERARRWPSSSRPRRQLAWVGMSTTGRVRSIAQGGFRPQDSFASGAKAGSFSRLLRTASAPYSNICRS